MKSIIEGKTEIKTYLAKEVSKDMPVFYNPVMKFNRDSSILLLNSQDNELLRIGDPMAGSGVRAVRFLTELDEDKIISIQINDISENAVKLIKENIKINETKICCDDISISTLDANQFMLESTGFDYIDIDPFGSPNAFLNSAVIRISRDGILAVTATDTAPLAGTYPKTCKRKYWSTPIRNEHMHEIGLRILIRKIQLIGAQFEKALIPIFSYYKDHYFRAFFLCNKSKTKVDTNIAQHGFFHYCTKCTEYFTSKNNIETCCEKDMDTAGPLWTGNISDTKLICKMIENCEDEKNLEILNMMHEESKIERVGFYDLHKIAKKNKTNIKRSDELIQELLKKGFKACKTHFNKYAIKTDAKLKDLE